MGLFEAFQNALRSSADKAASMAGDAIAAASYAQNANSMPNAATTASGAFDPYAYQSNMSPTYWSDNAAQAAQRQREEAAVGQKAAPFVNTAMQYYTPSESGQFDSYAYRQATNPDTFQNMSDSDRSTYRAYFDSKGGLKEREADAITDIGRSLAQMSGYNYSAPEPKEAEKAAGLFVDSMNRMPKDVFDESAYEENGITHGEATSKYMDGKTYKELAALGLGGRDLETIDETKAYNKLEEARDYGFRPYIEDGAQYASWIATQAADDNTKAMNMFRNIRNNMADAKVSVGDQSDLSRKDLMDNYGGYLDSSFDSLGSIFDEARVPGGYIDLLPADQADPDNSIAVANEARFPGKGPNGEELVIYLPEQINSANDLLDRYGYSDETGYNIVIPGHDPIIYDPSIEEDVSLFGGDGTEENPGIRVGAVPVPYAADPESAASMVLGYIPMEPMRYRQSDGRDVELSFKDAMDIRNGDFGIDYGPGNIAKNADERKGWTEMAASLDFSDILPNIVDLATGSAPLFIPQTAWTQAASGAIGAAQGLDSQSYDPSDNTYRKLSENITPDEYLLNIGLTGLMPVTERLAGGIGGAGGVVGRPLKEVLKRHGAPAGAFYARDLLGEFADEVVASAWEALMGNGFGDWYANPALDYDRPLLDQYGRPVYDENGEMQYRKLTDRTGHEVRTDTAALDRVMNLLSQAPENLIAGSALGGLMIAPGAIKDKATGSGMYADPDLAQRRWDIAHGLKPFRRASRYTDIDPNITEADIGSYGESRR